MDKVKNINVSSFRKEIGIYLNELNTKKIPLEIEKRIAGGSEKFILINKQDFSNILDKLNLTVNIFNENNQYILKLEELDLIVFEDTLEEAIDSLCYEVFDYAEEYLEEIEEYYKSKNRRNHFIYLIKIWQLNNDKNKLKEMFHYRDKK